MEWDITTSNKRKRINRLEKIKQAILNAGIIKFGVIVFYSFAVFGFWFVYLPGLISSNDPLKFTIGLLAGAAMFVLNIYQIIKLTR